MHKVRFALVLATTLILPLLAHAQFEAGAAYTHISGDGGLDGFTASMGWHFNGHVQLIGQTDFVWDNSRIGVFDLVPNVGTVTTKADMQQYLGGGRFRIIGFKPLTPLTKRKILPFGEVLMGVSRLNQSVKAVQTGVDVSAADSAFTWVVGAGVDYTLNRK